MNFYFSAYSTPLLVGFLQSWLYAILLWIRGKREERLSDILLGWVLVGMGFNIWEYMLGFGGIEFLWKELEFFPRNFGFLFPPLCYFYLKSQFNTDFRFRRRDWWHTLPFLIDVTYHLAVFSQGRSFVLWWEEHVQRPYHIDDIVFVLATIQGIVYLILALRLYRKYQKWIRNQFSDTDIISFRWFRNFLITLTISELFNLTMTIIDIQLTLSFWQDWWDELFGAVLIYYVSIAGYAQLQPRQRLTFVDQPVVLSRQPVSLPILENVPETNEVDDIADLEKKELSPELTEWRDRLLTYMTAERPYLEPELSLADLARRMHTNPTILSQVINTGVGKNFNDFVNQYRVEEFKQRVRNPANQHLSLLGIALDCGFNSKATFNRAFRKFTGLSPKEFTNYPTTSSL